MEEPSHKRSKSAVALSLLRGERPSKGDSGSESGSPITHTTSNSLLAPIPGTSAKITRSSGDGVSLAPIPEPPVSNTSLQTATKVVPSGIEDRKITIEDSVRTFRVFEVLRNGDTAAISKALKDASGSPISGTTILHLAIQCAEPEVVEYVLKNGGARDVNSRDKEGNTPLHLAAQLGRTPVVQHLLQHADVNESVANHQGRTPIDVARTPEIFQELQLARSLFIDSLVRQVHGFVAHYEHQKLEALLVDPRVESVLDVNALELVTDGETMATGGTLLHEGARKRDISLIQILLMHGADPFRRDRKGKLPQDVTKDDRTRGILKKSPAAAVAQRGIQEKAILGGSPSHKTAAGALIETGKEGREVKGYLKKWTNYTGGYKLRWFVLEDGVLSYYKHQDDAGSACRGAINMRIAKLHMDPQDKTRFEIHGKSSVKYHLKANHVVEAKRWFWSLNNAIQHSKDEAKEDDRRKSRDAGTLRQAKADAGEKSRPDADSLSMTSSKPTKLAPPSFPTTGGQGGSRLSGVASIRAESAFGEDSGSNYGSYEHSLTGGDLSRVATNVEKTGHDFEEEHDDDRSSNQVQPVNKDAFNITAQSAKFQLDLLARVSEALASERAQSPDMPMSDPSISQALSMYEAAVSSLDGLVVNLLKISRDRDAYWQYRLDKEADTRKMWEESMARIAQEHEELQRTVSESEEKRKRTKRALKEALEGQSGAVSRPASRGETGDRVQFAEAGENVSLNRESRASTHRQSVSSRGALRRKSMIAQYTNISDSESGDDDEFFDAIDAGEVQVVSGPVSPPTAEAPADVSISDEREAKRKEVESSFVGYEDPVRQKLDMEADNRPKISLWGILKSMIGKDMTRMTLPVSFNEPTSLLQRIAEDMEYADLLDIAASRPDSAERMVYVAAFAASEYASTIGRVAKPFNPLLGETFEYVRPDKGYRFLIEQVSHHPPIGAAYAESTNWDYFGESAVRSKFYGKTIDINHLGTWFLRLRPTTPTKAGDPVEEELYSWKKVTASVVGIITGNPTVDNYGPMEIKNWRTGERCMLDFKPRGWKASSAYQVAGKVVDRDGTTKWSIGGRWNDKIYARLTLGFEDQNISHASAPSTSSSPPPPSSTTSPPNPQTQSQPQPQTPQPTHLIWQAHPRPTGVPFNLTSFGLTLNALPAALRPWLPPTDTRLRPDQRAMEDGRYDRAAEEKVRVEEKQRGARREREVGGEEWRPRWFTRGVEEVSGEGYWGYGGLGGEYWGRRSEGGRGSGDGTGMGGEGGRGNWEGVCDDIF